MASMQVQSLIFEKDKFSRAEAVRWAKDHDFSASGVDETEESYRMRQEEPGKFKTMRTISLTEGVKAVVGKSDSPIEKAVSPEAIAKALYPGVDPVLLRAKILEDNDGFIGGTIRYGSGSYGSEFGSDYTDEGVRRNVDGPSERFSFGDLTFDVDAAKELCDGEPNEQIQVSDVWSTKINVDKVAAMRSTSTKPVLVAQIPTSKGLVPLLIDGHHRMYKAQQDGEEWLDAYVLTPEESLFICETHPDMETTLTKNLRDILDRPTVRPMTKEQVLENIASVWDKIIRKAQPGSSVHVPTAGTEQRDEDLPPESDPAEPGEDTPGGVISDSQNGDVGYDQPDFSGKVKRLKGKKMAKIRLDSLVEKDVPGSQSGIMVCLYIPQDVGQGLAVPGGEPVEDLHVTLAYIAKLGDDKVAFEAIVKCLKQVAEQYAPVQGAVGGIGIFNPSEGSDGRAVYYGSFNAPVLPSLLAAVRSALDWGGVSYAMQHGFTPHVTLKYLEDGDQFRTGVKTDPFRVPCISVASRALGRTDIEFTGTRINKEDGEVWQQFLKMLDEDDARPILKADRKKQIVYCVVLEPHTEDAQGDTMTPEDIEETAHGYLEKARKIGRRHKSIIDRAFPVESYIAPMDMQFQGGPYGDSLVTKGSWVIGIKVVDPSEWAKVESGEYQSVSVGGYGVRI